jgi:hypothetical protein
LAATSRCTLKRNALLTWVNIFCIPSNSVFTVLAARFAEFMLARPTLDMPSPAPSAKPNTPTMKDAIMSAFPAPAFTFPTGMPSSIVRRSNRPCWGFMPA